MEQESKRKNHDNLTAGLILLALVAACVCAVSIGSQRSQAERPASVSFEGQDPPGAAL